MEKELKDKSCKKSEYQNLNEDRKPYIDSKGDIILPSSWRDDEDDLSEEEYKRLTHGKF